MKLIMKERRKQVVVNAGPHTEAKKSDRPYGGGLHGFETQSGPTVRSEKPQTSQFCGFFSFKNRSMRKKQGPERTVVELYGSENRDRFFRFGLFLFVSAFLVNFGHYISMKLQ